MRPRLDAAENRAAWHGRRRPRTTSMRPRLDAAENAARHVPPDGPETHFNEAAARCRGKHAHVGRDPDDVGRLQ